MATSFQTQIIANQIQNATGALLASGTLYAQYVDATGKPINAVAGGGGQITTTPASTAITNGSIGSTFFVYDVSQTVPAGLFIHLWAVDSSTGQIVMDYPFTQPTGAIFILDNYTYIGQNLNVPTGQNVAGPLVVNGNLTVTGTLLSGTPSSGTAAVLGTFASPATSWTVNHNLGTQAIAVYAYDSSWNQIIPKNIQNNSVNQTTITFSQNQTGFAVCYNVGNWTPGVSNPNNIIANPISSQSIVGDFPFNIGGSLSAKRLQNIRIVGPSGFASIAAAQADIGTGNQGTIYVQPGYTDAYSSTLSIGWDNSGTTGIADGIKVIMLPGSSITFNPTTSLTADIVIYDGSTLECAGSLWSGDINGHNAPCQVVHQSGTSGAVVATGHIVNSKFQDTVGVQGVLFEVTGGTVTSVMDIAAVGAPSEIRNNTLFVQGGTVTNGLYVHNGAGGGMKFQNNQLRFANNNLRGIYITGAEATGYQGQTSTIVFDGGEVSCVSNNSTIVINGDPQAVGAIGVSDIQFNFIHSQNCTGGINPTDYVKINNAIDISFNNTNLTSGAAHFITLTQSGAGAFKTGNIVVNQSYFGCANANCSGQVLFHDTTTHGVDHHFQSNTLSIANFGIVSWVDHDEAGSFSDNGFGAMRYQIYNTSSSDFAYPHAPLEVIGPSAAPATTAGSWIARFNGAGTASLLIGDNAYVGPWLQALQDDGTNNVKTIALNPLGGAVNIGSGGFSVNGSQTISGVAGSGASLVTNTSPTITTPVVSGNLQLGSVVFASLGTPSNGTIIYCSDCTVANPCAGSGTGALAKRINGAWVCN